MKAPKLMAHNSLTLTVLPEDGQEMSRFNVVLHDATEWPTHGSFDKETAALRLFDSAGNELCKTGASMLEPCLDEFQIHFVKVTDSRVNLKTKSQSISAILRSSAMSLQHWELTAAPEEGYME